MRTTHKPVSQSDKAEGAVTDCTFGQSDGARAQGLLQDTFEVRAGRNVKAAIGDAFEALKRHERRLPEHIIRERDRQWTERRVRSLWENTARRVDHYEIQDLTAVAVEEAKLERQRLRAREARLEALIASADQGHDQPLHQQQGRRPGRLDMPRGSRAGDDDRAGWGI